MDDAQKTRLARNEDLFRGLNEEINEAAESHGEDSHPYEFFCECSDRDCVERVELTLREYRHIRAEPTRFVLKSGHVVREIEHVVETDHDHVVVEKHGRAGRVAAQLDAETAAESA